MAKDTKKTKQKQLQEWLDFHDDLPGSRKDKAEQFKKVSKVREAFEDARNGRQTNNYWYTLGNGDSGGYSSDWNNHWDKIDKAYIQWTKKSSVTDFKANVKSPDITARVNTFVNQYKKLNLAWSIHPNNNEDKPVAKVSEKVLQHWFDKSNAASELALVAQDSAKYGTGIFRTYYAKQTKAVRMPKKPTKEDKKALEDGEVLLEEQMVTTYDDPVIEHIPIREFYPDPEARCIHGTNYPARYVIRRRKMHIERFRSIFGSHPKAQNIKKVKPMGQFTDDYQTPFFEPPESNSDAQTVEVLEFEGQLDEFPYHDYHVVVANDILVLDSVLPNHKEITYQRMPFVKLSEQFYGLGLADLSLNNQGHVEILLNMSLDYMYKTFNKQYFINSEVYGDVEQGLINPDDEFIPLDLSSGLPLNGVVSELPISPLGFDPFRMQEILQDNITKSTQMDPQQLGLVNSQGTATEAVMNKEQLEMMAQGVISDFAVEDLRVSGRQVLKLIQQHWTVPRVKEVMGDTQETKYRTLRFDNTEVKVDVEGDKDIEFIESDTYDFFEAKPEYIQPSEELDIAIRPDSLEIKSKAIRMKKTEDALAQLAPFIGNPENPASQQNPLAVIDIHKVISNYLESHDMPQDIKIGNTFNDKREIEEAEAETMVMWSGEKVPGEPGRSEAHRRFHQQALAGIIAEIENVQKDLMEYEERETEKLRQQMEESGMLQDPQIDPMTGEPILPEGEIEVNEELEAKLEKLSEFRDKLAQHLAMDNQVVENAIEATLEAAAPPPEPQMPPMPQQGMPGMEGVGGPAVPPPMPGQGGQLPPELGGGQVPMAGGDQMQTLAPEMGGIGMI